MKYATPIAFKAALEDRLRNRLWPGDDLARLRQLVIYERFLCRVLQLPGHSFVLKGGVVLELRLPFARATKDIDLRATGSPGELLDTLRKAGRRGLDPLRFEVSEDPRHPTIDSEGMVYEGLRFRERCTLAGKPYGRPFGLDIAFADPLFGEPETLPPSTWFDFAALAGVPVPVVPVETHIAEKLHAYTLPRGRPNSRLKDLPDLALLSRVRSIEAAALRDALALTFEHRGTHAVPAAVPSPPMDWAERYPRFARGSRLPWDSLDEVEEVVRAFLDPVLSGQLGTWAVESGRWVVPGGEQA